MKNLNLMGIVCLLLLLSSTLFGQKNIKNQIAREHTAIKSAAISSPFTEVNQNVLENKIPDAVLDQKQAFQIDVNQLTSIRSNQGKYLRINIPIENQNKELLLVKADIFHSDFRLELASNPGVNVNTNTGVHYWGTVENEPNSLVCLSFLNDQIAGFINYDNQQYDLGKVDNSDYHVLYKNGDLNGYPGFSCEAITLEGATPSTQLAPVQQSVMAGCVRIHMEVDYSLYQDKSSNVTTTSDFVYALFAQTAILYANESINTDISFMRIWDTPSPYSANDPLGDLNNQNYGRTNGDLVHVLHTMSGGGVAYVDVICQSSLNTGVSGIFGSFSNVPTYSWDVEVLTHELGHNFGSPHTHACAWNGNNTAIDGCGPAAGYDEGCAGSLPANGGTIMSYCHLVSGTGINFNFGFGQQPGDLVRSRVNNATCLIDCQCADGIQNGDETGVDCGGSCPNACPTCTDGIMNGDETGLDCGGSGCPDCPPEDCSTFVFANNVLAYDPGQDFGTATVQDGGATLFIEGNVWKAVEINYTFTPNTVIEFDFQSTSQGEIHEISLDNDLIVEPDVRVVVYGNQGYAGDYTNPIYSGSGNFEHFIIPLNLTSTITYQYLVLSGDDDANAAANSYFRNIQIYEDYDGSQTCDGSLSNCTDGIQNGDETGVDCGGSICPACPTCTDGIQNGDETGVDCGGSCPNICPTCSDGTQNGNETGVDCGGPDCAACPTCSDGTQNGNETGVDCGGPDCSACPTCTDGIQNGDELGVDCGGLSCSDCPENCDMYDLSNAVVSYDTGGNDAGTATIQDEGMTVYITGNGWKAIPINYTVTPYTVMEFDFKSTVQGEIHEIAFDTDLTFAPSNRFVIYGDQGYAGDYTNQIYSGSGNFEHFVLPLGANFTGSFTYLVLTADDDADAVGDSYFSNIQIYEDYNNDLSCNNACPSIMSINDPVSTGVYAAGNEVDCSSSVNGTSTVILQAGNKVKLTDGFSTPINTDFRAIIKDCSSN